MKDKIRNVLSKVWLICKEIPSWTKAAIFKVRDLLIKAYKKFLKFSPDLQVCILSVLVIFGLITLVRMPDKFKKSIELPSINSAEPDVSGVGEEITISIAGDIMIHDGLLSDAKQEDGSYNFSKCFSEINNLISSSDISIANFNGVISENDAECYGYPYFFSPEVLCENLRDTGFDVISLCNTQSNNNGKKGIESTTQAFSNVGIKTFGTSETNDPLFIIQDGIRIALISAVDPSVYSSEKQADLSLYNCFDRELLRKSVDKCRLWGADVIIAFTRWGETGESIPTSYMTEWSDFLVSLGVDAVIGGGSHIPMPIRTAQVGDDNDIDQLDKGHIYYSLGNFISNQRDNGGYMGYVLNLTIRKISQDETRIVDSEVIPVYTNVDISDGKNFKVVPVYENASAPSWMDESNAEKFYSTYEIVNTLTQYSGN